MNIDHVRFSRVKLGTGYMANKISYSHMKNYLTSVGIVTGILIVFVTLIQMNVAHLLIWGIFLAGPFLIGWMVWSVLTAPVKVKETFDEQWYQDRPDWRRKPGSRRQRTLGEI